MKTHPFISDHKLWFPKYNWMTIILTYLSAVSRPDHFFQRLEEFSWKPVYLDFSVKHFLFGKVFQYLSQLLVLPTDLLKINNFSIIHRSYYRFPSCRFYSRVVCGWKWGLQRFKGLDRIGYFLKQSAWTKITLERFQSVNNFRCSALFLLWKCLLNMLYIC